MADFKTEHFNFATWNSYATESKTQLFLGVPAAEYAGAGYQSAAEVVRMASVLNAK